MVSFDKGNILVAINIAVFISVLPANQILYSLAKTGFREGVCVGILPCGSGSFYFKFVRRCTTCLKAIKIVIDFS